MCLLLLLSLFVLNAIACSLVTVPVTYLLTLATNPISSRVLDKALSASSVAGKYKRKLIQRFMGHYHVLADDRIGSHVAERAWESADPFLKVLLP